MNCMEAGAKYLSVLVVISGVKGISVKWRWQRDWGGGKYQEAAPWSHRSTSYDGFSGGH